MRRRSLSRIYTANAVRLLTVLTRILFACVPLLLPFLPPPPPLSLSSSFSLIFYLVLFSMFCFPPLFVSYSTSNRLDSTIITRKEYGGITLLMVTLE